jgi:hypothetical protein
VRWGSRTVWLILLLFVPATGGVAATHEVWLNEQNGLLIVQVQTAGGKRTYVLDSAANISATWDGKAFVVILDGKKHPAGGVGITRRARPELASAALAPGVQIDGLLGGDFLRQFTRWTIDYRRHKLILEDE